MAAERRLLVVDDDKNVRFVLSQALRALSTHYEILSASDAHEALNLLEQQAFDLVITDINLPGINGVDLTEKLLTESPNTAVIWITAYGCHRMARKRAYTRVFICLEKPISIDEIREAALKALRERDRTVFGRTRHERSNISHVSIQRQARLAKG
jgi:DNA-binding NtrC family response regulator